MVAVSFNNEKIEDIVRQEQNKIGAQEILMPTIQSSEI